MLGVPGRGVPGEGSQADRFLDLILCCLQALLCASGGGREGLPCGCTLTPPRPQGRPHRGTAGHAGGRQPGHEADHHRDVGAGPGPGQPRLRAHLQGYRGSQPQRGQAPQVAGVTLASDCRASESTPLPTLFIAPVFSWEGNLHSRIQPKILLLHSQITPHSSIKLLKYLS